VYMFLQRQSTNIPSLLARQIDPGSQPMGRLLS